MRIFGAEFESVGGNGTLDTSSPNTILHAGDTGDSDTRAVVELQAQDYDVEFLTWERAGGAYYELTAQRGEFLSFTRDQQPQWLAVGDPSEVAERTEALGGDSIAVMDRAHVGEKL